ncbi:MAG TPA: nuclear transport factor 2 family protein [Cyclobacteriaceae bacterium]
MNKIAIGLLLILFISGCSKKLPPNENGAIVISMFDAFNRHDWKAMADHYIDSASFLDPSFGKEYVIQSKAALASKYEEMQKFLPDIHDEVIGLYPSGNKVSVEFISTGTMPDGTKFKLPISCILTLENGKIVKDATYYDQENQ